jgi:uncharacterized protein
MEIRDPVHGHIHLHDEEIPIIHHDFFQRLRNIKQLGLTEYVFPGGTHTRYIHSLGVMEIGTKAFDRLFAGHLEDQKIQRLRETFRLAGLLHDLGHAPLSHSTETVMPGLKDLQIPKKYLAARDLVGSKIKDRRATHEDYTIKAIVDSSFTSSFSKVEKKFGLEPQFIADLIFGETKEESFFTYEGINYFPLLHQLISSELDCDRMDYLLRDSYFCGVSYGNFDLDWLIENLEACPMEGKAFLGISERAVVTFDDFLLSRYHMFVMVYFHYKSVCLEQLLYKYFQSAPEEYKIPADIEEYMIQDDHHLMKVLRKSQNTYAQAIVKNKIPDKIYESFNDQQLRVLEDLQRYLEDNKIDFIRCSSLGRLSKYHHEPQPMSNYSLKVTRTLKDTAKKIYSDISEATDLFQKFSKSHAVNRLHCDLKNLTPRQQNKIIELIHQS